jgi:thiol-disulfide isomerase/thioredoxin
MVFRRGSQMWLIAPLMRKLSRQIGVASASVWGRRRVRIDARLPSNLTQDRSMPFTILPVRSCIGLGATAFFALLLSIAWQNACASEEPARPDSRGSIAGKIVDRTGAPVTAARVTLYRWESPTRRWGKWKIVHRAAKVDQAGNFRFAPLARDYFMLSIEGEGFARAFRDLRIDNDQPRDVKIVLLPPATATIQIVDEAGKPAVGARVRGFLQRGVNGQGRFGQLAINSLGIKIAPSDANGRLQLPALPAGDVLQSIKIDHPSFAPAEVRELMIAPGAAARLTLRPGVVVTLRVPIDLPESRIAGAVVDLRHEPFENPSTIVNYEAEFDRNGTARLTLEPGKYSWLLLQHRDFFLTPAYSAEPRKTRFLQIEEGRNRELHFAVRRKVAVRGRIVDAETGKALREMAVLGELANGPIKGWDDAPPEEWSFAGWGESDERGAYRIALAAGRSRISFQGNGYLPEQGYYELSVAPDGSTTVPDIRVRSLPRLVGAVQGPDGKPVAKAVVRLRGRYSNLSPVLTDDSGRFELDVKYILLDEATGKRAFDAQLVAFDPYSPLAASAEIRLNRPEPAVLKLERHEPAWLLSAFQAEMSDWERGILDAKDQAQIAANSLRGKSPPPLDGVAWLNTGGKALKLSDLRGKYVLLDFWFKGCGPCHADFPSVKYVHELYKDKGVVVIGVHNNSETAEAVRAHVAEIGLPIPIVVDHPDGRMISRFESYGIPTGYPDYVLISPEGKVLLDDRTIPHPTLRSYKLEIVRKLLLEAEAAK